MKSVKSTTLLEAVAGAIQYEKDCFEYFLKAYEDAKEGSPLKEFFQQMAEDADEHIKLIQNIYNELKGGVSFPNLKELAPIHKFHSSALQKMMRRTERNLKIPIKSLNSEVRALEHALKISEDTKNFYNKMKNKFADPDIKILFNRLGAYSEENRLMVEAQHLSLTQKDRVMYYWDDEEMTKSTSKK